MEVLHRVVGDFFEKRKLAKQIRQQGIMITKMKSAGIIYEVTGRGKGKYKFIANFMESE